MSRLNSFIEQGNQDLPVYITDVRQNFLAGDGIDISLDLTKFNGCIRRILLRVPAGEMESAAQRDFIRDYLFAEVYNTLSALGGQRLDIYVDTGATALAQLLNEIPKAFGIGIARKDRSGYGRSVNVIERMLDSQGSERPFTIQVHDMATPPALPVEKNRNSDFVKRFEKALVGIDKKILCGVDIGGTDIKLAVSACGKLRYLKEYDWFPAMFTRSSQLIEPILLLVRLLRARVSCDFAQVDNAVIKSLDYAVNNHLPDGEMERIISGAENALDKELSGFDSIGLCFPDVVIKNKIVGGEVFKTRGIRNNPSVEYEGEFRKLTNLGDLLHSYCIPGGKVGMINDGSMAAFTAAMELIAGDKSELLKNGRFAYALGTELGTGWIDEVGEIPEIPLEIYNFIIDLGSFGARQYQSDDLRSIRNFNTGLSGTVQKFMAQNGVFRLAIKASLAGDGKLYRDLLDGGFIHEKDGGVFISLVPNDMRKPLLEYLMKLCGNGSHELEQVFWEIGRSTGITFCESEHILNMGTRSCILYGRLVKLPRCFELIKQGAAEVDGGLYLSVADEQNAYTNLMLQLKSHPIYTVAQFAQAVGALYFGNL